MDDPSSYIMTPVSCDVIAVIRFDDWQSDWHPSIIVGVGE
jgi:hypothetical protein